MPRVSNGTEHPLKRRLRYQIMMTSSLSPSPSDFDPFVLAADRYELFAELRRHHPLFYSERFDVWLVSRFGDVQAIARDWQTFSHAHGVDFDGSDRIMFGRGDFLQQDPPRHRALRDVVKRWFTPKAIGGLEPLVRTTIRELIGHLAERGEAELLADFAKPIPLTVFSRLLGLRDEDMPRIQRWTEEMMVRAPGEPEIPSSAIEAAMDVRAYLAEQAAAKADAREQDILSDVAKARCAGAIDAEELSRALDAALRGGRRDDLRPDQQRTADLGCTSRAAIRTDRGPDGRTRSHRGGRALGEPVAALVSHDHA